MPYTAVTPGWDGWKFKVIDTKTGGVKWITGDEYKGDFPEYGGSGRYVEYGDTANGPPSGSEAWVVQVNDKNGKNVGIYVDAENGKVLKAILDQGSSKKSHLQQIQLMLLIRPTQATPQSPYLTDQQAITQDLYSVLLF